MSGFEDGRRLERLSVCAISATSPYLNQVLLTSHDACSHPTNEKAAHILWCLLGQWEITEFELNPGRFFSCPISIYDNLLLK